MSFIYAYIIYGSIHYLYIYIYIYIPHKATLRVIGACGVGDFQASEALPNSPSYPGLSYALPSSTDRRTNGRTDGHGRTDRRTNRRTDGQSDGHGRTDRLLSSTKLSKTLLGSRPGSLRLSQAPPQALRSFPKLAKAPASFPKLSLAFPALPGSSKSIIP